MPYRTMRVALVAATLTSIFGVASDPLRAQSPEPAPDRTLAPPPPPAPAVTQAPCASARSVGSNRPGDLVAQPNPLANAQQGTPMPLFYNYYVGPPGVPAQIYPGPRPTPAFVGQVWITYPPLMPHEFLYKHNRTYYKYTPGGYTSATVRYR